VKNVRVKKIWQTKDISGGLGGDGEVGPKEERIINSLRKGLK
jgi:hypothetical protein